MHPLHAATASFLLLRHAFAAPSLQKRDTIDTSAGASPFRVSIKTANGTDLTPSFPAMVGDVTPPNPSARLAKRDVARAQETCPDRTSWFSHSYCNRQASAFQNTFVIECDDPDTSTVGTCLPGELCVDGIRAGLLSPVVAYCVSLENFVKIAADKVSQGVTGTLPAGSADWDQENVAIEAVLTATDGNSPILYAERMEIQAYDAFGVPTGGTAGVNTCTGVTTCASIGLQPLPHGTTEVGIDITLPDGSLGGNLFLPVVSPLISG